MSQESTVVDLEAHRKALIPTGKDALLAYWNEIGGALDVPGRDAIDPARISGLLGEIVLIERIAPRQAKIRLAGQAIGNAVGIEPRGMPMTSLISTASRGALEDAMEALFDRPSMVELELAGPKTPFRRRMHGELLLLPLRDREDQITRAICYASLPERRTKAPLRFDIMDTRLRRLKARVAAPVQTNTPIFEDAERARDVLRRRQSFRIVDPV
ncbi:PAS domain-containing protein [Palleronia abyssalis]|uniref:PAS domain-containing protein n=1 Tax=Palleronia abyssalis TaxID=1501240 RepID=A0A2R8BQ99_9RHOB|nr:PAS domain-containing protein [Palleronia abyssalis]SPJ22311.1 hypothetical protein PAA8504_00101 [Palleronia abyssalis]